MTEIPSFEEVFWYYMLMVNKTHKKRTAGRRAIISVWILLAFLLSITVFFVIQNVVKPNLSKSQQNIQLMKEARNRLDPTICDQIKGGVEAEKLPERKGVQIYANLYPEMTEPEARERCRSDIQWQVEHLKK